MSPKQNFCNSHWFSHQLPLLWQALSDGFCKCFSMEKALSAPSVQLWFLISLRSACQVLPHPSGQSDGYAAAPGLPSADQSATEVTVKEATGAADSYRDWDLFPPPSLVCWRDAKMSFSFPQESDLLKTNSDWRQFPSPSTQSKIYWQTEKPIAKICFCNKSGLCWPVKTAIESQLWKKIILYRMMQLCFNLSGYFFQQWT